MNTCNGSGGQSTVRILNQAVKLLVLVHTDSYTYAQELWVSKLWHVWIFKSVGFSFGIFPVICFLPSCLAEMYKKEQHACNSWLSHDHLLVGKTISWVWSWRTQEWMEQVEYWKYEFVNVVLCCRCDMITCFMLLLPWFLCSNKL